jgi:hypothetical protein
MKKKISAVILIIFLAVLSFGMKRIQSSCKENSLPPTVRTIIEKKYAQWKITTEKDLTQDDQKLWAEIHPGECPGIAIGNFENPKFKSYAVLLIQREKNRLYNLLILIGKLKGEKYEVRVLSERSEVTIPQVIFKMPPGVYYSPDRSTKIEVNNDVIFYAQLEAGATMYYWSKDANTFQSFIVSD